jgi:hypothetical protein
MTVSRRQSYVAPGRIAVTASGGLLRLIGTDLQGCAPWRSIPTKVRLLGVLLHTL